MQIAMNGCDENERCTDHEKSLYPGKRTTRRAYSARRPSIGWWSPSGPARALSHLILTARATLGNNTGLSPGPRPWRRGLTSPLAITWGVLLNAKNSRSQHQAHFRTSRLAEAEKDPLQPRNLVVDAFRQQSKFSTNWRHPTITWEERVAMFASIFSRVMSETRSWWPRGCGPIIGPPRSPRSAWGRLCVGCFSRLGLSQRRTRQAKEGKVELAACWRVAAAAAAVAAGV